MVSFVDSRCRPVFYGCNLAGSADGIELLESLEAITGADLAASDDLTGHESFGGDWDLEYRSGDISDSELISANLKDDWNSLLAKDTHSDNYLVGENDSLNDNLLENDKTGGFVLAASPVLNFDANLDSDDAGTWVDQTKRVESGNWVRCNVHLFSNQCAKRDLWCVRVEWGWRDV